MTPKEADGDGIMARTKLLVFGVLASLAANAAAVPPHAHYSDTVRSADGKPVPGAKVLVCSAGTDVKAKVSRGESAGTTKSAFLLDLTSAAKDASSTGWNLRGHLAFDGNKASRWSSVAGLPPVARPTRKNEWIWVDCGADVRLRSVWVDFQDSASVDYTVRLLTEKEGTALNLGPNGRAGGGVENWKIIASAQNLPNGVTSPNRKLPGVRDKWDFVNGSAVIPDNRSGQASVEVTNPIGRYLLIDTTRTSDPGYGNVSIWEIAVETERQENGPPMRSVLYTTDTDNFVEQPNPITTDQEGLVSFYVQNGDYDLHVSGANDAHMYSLTDVALVNPHRPHAIRASSGEIPLTLVQGGEQTSGGNNALSLGRPGSTDANNPPTPYRMFVNKGKQAWALTLNADWDEKAGAWMPRRIRNQSFVFRINGEDHSLEYGNDSFTDHNPPVMETLFRISADGEIWTKAYGGYHGLAMEVRNKTGRKLQVGSVVVLDPSSPFAVILPRRRADLNPAVIYKVDGDRIFILIAGRMTPHMGSAARPGDLLVTEGAGSVRAVVGSKAIDPRAVLGTVSDKTLLTIIR
ncbi:MAG: hypothetical protein VCA37_03470 [Roseibacillus sp.]